MAKVQITKTSHNRHPVPELRIYLGPPTETLPFWNHEQFL
jgi:hypothetical protein